MSGFVVKDSGKREEFVTGSVRDSNEGRGRFDLVSPIGLERLAQLYERGARKYGERNWEKGQKLSRYLNSAERHLNAYKAGDRSEDHLAAVAWNAFGFMHTEELVRRGELPAELDDLPKRKVAERALGKTVADGCHHKPNGPRETGKKPLAYVSGPYRDKRGPAFVERNIRRAEAVAQDLWQMGFAVICPHLNTKHFDGLCPDSTWIEGDLVMVERCDLVVMAPGWQKSEGANIELNHAIRHNVKCLRWIEDHGILAEWFGGNMLAHAIMRAPDCPAA